MRLVRLTVAAVAAALLGVAAVGPAGAATVDGLYEAVGAGDASDTGRAAAAGEALRQVAVRVTGRRAAATDPALAGLYADARRYARTFRSVGGNQVAVAFDPDALEAALLQAGQRLWPAERPLTLVVLVGTRPGAPRALGGGVEPDVRRAVIAAAQLRGLPLAWPTGMPAALEQARVDDALAGRLEPLRELARQFGADAVLLGRVAPGTTTWNWAGPGGDGSASGAADEGVHALADRLGAQFATAGARAGHIDAVVRGVRDVAGYALATSTLAGLAGVRGVLLEEVSGDTLRFRIAFDGDGETLRREARDCGRFLTDDAATPAAAVQLVLRP